MRLDVETKVEPEAHRDRYLLLEAIAAKGGQVRGDQAVSVDYCAVTLAVEVDPLRDCRRSPRSRHSTSKALATKIDE